MIPDLKTIDYYVSEVYGNSITLDDKSKKHFAVEKKAMFSIIATKFYHHTEITKYSTIKRLDILYYNSQRCKLNFNKRFNENLSDIIDRIMIFANELYYLSMGTY